MSSKRQDLIEAALCLFNERGYHATGIDAILARAGVAKNTLYKHFRSKDELILAALRLKDEQQRNEIMRRVESRAQTPKDRLLAVFDVVEDWFRDPDFHGCLFIRASGEFADTDDPVHRVCLEHSHLLRGYLERLARSAGASDPEGLSKQLLILLTGSMVAAQIRGDAAPARVAKQAASTLIQSQCTPSGG